MSAAAAAASAASGAAGGAAHGMRAIEPNELAPDARQFYDQLMAFKANPRQHELTFPSSITAHQRKQLVRAVGIGAAQRQ